MVTAPGVARRREGGRPEWAPDFVDARAWARVERYCDARYVECRLQEGAEELDYLMAFRRPAANAVRQGLAAALELAADDARPAWTCIARLFEAWSDGTSRLSLGAPDVWLEFDDVASERRAARLPSPSVCMTPAYGSRRTLFPSEARRDLPLIQEIAEHLSLPLALEELALVRECFRELPPRSRFIHFSAMLARPSRALKLYGVVPRAELLPFLERVGWAGDPAELRAVMSELYPLDLLGDFVFFDLNLSSLRVRARATLGLAVAQQHLVHGPDRDPLRTAVTERWCRAGLASFDKVAVVRELLLDGAPRALRSGRFLDLKLVWNAGSPPLAKAYVGFHGQVAELPW